MGDSCANHADLPLWRPREPEEFAKSNVLHSSQHVNIIEVAVERQKGPGEENSVNFGCWYIRVSPLSIYGYALLSGGYDYRQSLVRSNRREIATQNEKDDYLPRLDTTAAGIVCGFIFDRGIVIRNVDSVEVRTLY